MNTNSNTYTIVYSAIIVILVAAILAFASMALKPKQDANIKAETISQMLTAAQFYTKEECDEMGNVKVLEAYSKNIKRAFVINAQGDSTRALGTEAKNIELQDGLKAQDLAIKSGKNMELPVYVFEKDGKEITVIPCYGNGLWGPIWGYLAFNEDLKTFLGAYFDHDSETPGLGAKIKDDPDFRAKFIGKIADFSQVPVFDIVKTGTKKGQPNAIDGISGATITTNGLRDAVNTWLIAYKPYFEK
ncbi:MAG: NADH:ubiquinone reductase (Na(+)-transporting) subunit C [Candidatus Cryptobacteroides sp.]|jgi:Na+-transporting NADH:ubiquinone oxidoreductase subunit C